MLLIVIFVSGISLAAPKAHQTAFEDSLDLQEYRKVCGNQYSLACLKADLVRLIQLLSRSSPIKVMPGISVSSSGIHASLIGLNQRTADDILATALTDFFRSITIHISLFNENFTDIFGIGSENSDNFTGRLKRFKFLTIYTTFAIAFALLSALVGKAMSLSIVSLVISLIARNGGIGNNNNSNSPPAVYDIVRRPHIQFANTHSSEEIFEGARTGSPYPYGYSGIYGRTTMMEPYSAHFLQNKLKINSQNTTQQNN